MANNQTVRSEETTASLVASGALRSPTDSELTRHMMERHDARDFSLAEQRERLKRLPPEDGTSAGMSNAHAVMRRINFRIRVEDDLEPWAVY